jgi:hypothetical protein
MVVTKLTELLRDALVDRGFLGLEEAECVYVRKDLGGKPHIEAAGLAANSSKRFLAAMEEMLCARLLRYSAAGLGMKTTAFFV